MALLRMVLSSLCVVLVAIPAFAAPLARTNVSLRDVIATVENSFKTDRTTGLPVLQDVTADFMQSSTLAEKGREMRADGEMFFKTATSREPLMFRFDYFHPANQQIISNGRTLWVYLPANRQVIQSDVSFVFNPFAYDAERTRAVNFLQGLGRISQDFMVNFSSQMQDVNGNYILELEPRRNMVSIARLFMVVSRDAVMNRFDSQHYPPKQDMLFPVRSTTVIDPQGNSTIIEFSNIRTNTRIPLSYFDFDVPPGIQVVKPPTGR